MFQVQKCSGFNRWESFRTELTIVQTAESGGAIENYHW